MHNSRNGNQNINQGDAALFFFLNWCMLLIIYVCIYNLGYCIRELQKYPLLQTADFTVAILVTGKEHQRLSPWAHYFYVYGVCPGSGAEIRLEMSDYHDETKSFGMYAKIKVGLSYHFKANNRGTKFWNIVAIEPFVDAQNTGQSKQKKEVGFLGE